MVWSPWEYISIRVLRLELFRYCHEFMNWLYWLHVCPWAEILQLSAISISWLTLHLKWGSQFPDGESWAWKCALAHSGSWNQAKDPICCESLGRVIRPWYTRTYIHHTQQKTFLNGFRKGRQTRIWKYCATNPPFHILCGKQLHLALSFELWDSTFFCFSKHCL